MKKVLKIVFIISLVVLSILLLVIGNGYSSYKTKLKESPLKEKVENIRKQESYVTIKEVPQTYIDAVISVEDHRFYKHKGIP